MKRKLELLRCRLKNVIFNWMNTQMEEIKEIKNKYGIWIDIEETMNWNYEINFNEKGLSINGKFICDWDKLDRIKKECMEMGNGN